MIQLSRREVVLPLRQFRVIPDVPGKMAVMLTILAAASRPRATSPA